MSEETKEEKEKKDRLNKLFSKNVDKLSNFPEEDPEFINYALRKTIEEEDEELKKELDNTPFKKKKK